MISSLLRLKVYQWLHIADTTPRFQRREPARLRTTQVHREVQASQGLLSSISVSSISGSVLEMLESWGRGPWVISPKSNNDNNVVLTEGAFATHQPDSKPFTCTWISLNSYSNLRGSYWFIPILQVRKLRHRAKVMEPELRSSFLCAIPEPYS